MLTKSSPRAARLAGKWLTALMVAAAWGALGYGLVWSPPDIAAWQELEAGGRFGMNFSVYLPYYALSVPIAAAVIIGLFPRPDWMFPLTAGMAVTALVAARMLGDATLLSVQPQLAGYALVAIGLDAVAIIPLLIAYQLKTRPRSPTFSSSRASARRSRMPG